jgi:ribosome-binding protein aMBF1 (putative translation factor)
MARARKKPRRRNPARVDQYRSRAYRDLQVRLVVNVQEVREERGWTQEEAAHRCEMATRILQRVEAGEVNLTLTSLARLCEGLQVDVVRLLRSVRK